MIHYRTLTHKDELYHLEIEKNEFGEYSLSRITADNGKELKNLINSDIELAILEELYS